LPKKTTNAEGWAKAAQTTEATDYKPLGARVPGHLLRALKRLALELSERGSERVTVRDLTQEACEDLLRKYNKKTK